MHFPTPRTFQRHILLRLREGHLLLTAAGFFLTLCTAILLIFPPRFIQLTELHLYDTMLADRTTPPKTTTPVLVGIDDESLEAYGQWPWPRYRLASLVQRLHALGADVIALDFFMPEQDRTSPEVIMEERERDFGISTASPPRPVPRDSNSDRLAASLVGGNVILGYYFDFSGVGSKRDLASPVLPSGMVVTGAPGVAPVWPRPTHMLRSLSTLTAAASAEGFTNAPHDIDGVLRRVPLLLRHQEKYVPSLSLGAVLLSSPERRLRLVKDGNEAVLEWGGRRIPFDRNGNFMIDYRSGKKSFSYLSAKDILRGTQTTESLRGKIVLVGSWARGLGDIHQVPTALSLNGLEVHATIIDNLLSGTFLYRPSWARGAELFGTLLLGGLSTLLLRRSGFFLSLLIVLTGVGGCYLGGRELLLSEGIFLSPLLPMTTPLVVMTVMSLLKYGIEARKVRQHTDDLAEAQGAIILSMSTLAEERDAETGEHLLRTKSYVEVLARHLATLPHYSHLDETCIELLVKSAPLHDIGKIGIPDNILHKPGRLTTEEFAIIKTHTLIGARALTRSVGGISNPENLDFLRYASQMTESHHEKWDGSGYPHGLSGANIPLAGRLMALADVYDALVSKRVYKQALSHAEARESIIEGSGQQFDPELIAAFVANEDEFIRIALMFTDPHILEAQNRP